MKILSNFNKDTKDIQYILEDQNIHYDLSTMLNIEIPFSNSFLINIPEEDLITDFDTIIDAIPSKIIENIFPDNNILVTNNEQYGWYYVDSLSQERIMSLIFTYIDSRYNHGYTLVKLSSFSEYFVMIKQYCGVEDCDHPMNNKIYNEYYIYLKTGTKLFSNLLSYNYDYKFDNIDIGILDGNNPVYHHRMMIKDYDTDELSIIQNINFILDMDIYSLRINHLYNNISKIMYYINDEESCLEISDPDIILKTKVSDIFGNLIEFGDFKDHLLRTTKVRKNNGK